MNYFLVDNSNIKIFDNSNIKMSVGDVVNGWKISFKTDDEDIAWNTVYSVRADDVIDKVRECIRHTHFHWETYSKRFDKWTPHLEEPLYVMLDNLEQSRVKITRVTLELELKPKYLFKGWQTLTKKA